MRYKHIDIAMNSLGFFVHFVMHCQLCINHPLTFKHSQLLCQDYLDQIYMGTLIVKFMTPTPRGIKFPLDYLHTCTDNRSLLIM